MEAVGATSAIVGLAIPVFKSAKELRDKIKLVASEKAELMTALTEYEKDINLLESLYNDHKELLDQHKLDTDLKELAEILRDLDEWLDSINPDLGKKNLPGLKELCKSGDLGEKLVASNANISSVRARWQMRLQICTVVRLGSVKAKMTAQFQQVLTMLQQGSVRQRFRSLSMHPQVEPPGFNSQTTRVVANTTTSMVTFSILSPDTSLSYDHIKLRLEEYRTLLSSDLDTIELSTENGKILICLKKASGMEAYLNQAVIFLRDVVRSRDISALVVLHHLRDFAEALDDLKLYNECRLTGNCALDLAEALGRRSLEFRQEQAETLALIAGLSAYQPRARTLFIRAVSICEGVVANNASHSNKNSLLIVLGRAGYWASDHLRAELLGRAIQLMTKELPATMVHPERRSIIYYDYGLGLFQLMKYANAIEAYNEAISIRRTLVKHDPVKHNPDLAQTLTNMGNTHHRLEEYGDATVAYKEALEICTTMSAQDPRRYNEIMAATLLSYGITLEKSKQVPEAAVVKQRAVSLYRDLGNERIGSLCAALHNYGHSCYLLGRYEEAVLVYQESIPWRRILAAANPEKQIYLIAALHNIANSFRALDKHDEASTAADEALARNLGRVVEECNYAPDFKACFVCQRGVIPDSLQNVLPPLPFFRAISSPRPAEDTRADATLTSPETPKPTGETANAPVRKKRDRILGLFSGNRAR